MIISFTDSQIREFHEDVDWNLHFSRNFTTRELEEASSLSQVLSGVRMKAELEDRRAWLDDKENFSVKSMFQSLFSEGFHGDFLW